MIQLFEGSIFIDCDSEPPIGEIPDFVKEKLQL